MPKVPLSSASLGPNLFTIIAEFVEAEAGKGADALERGFGSRLMPVVLHEPI